jgi:D-beta-D-heptose 7-phosphate kinase/D-beta-D-heptose 1-phosphate adenosyltransferase
VADAKRPPSVYQGAILKCNQGYLQRYSYFDGDSIVTRGYVSPVVWNGRACNSLVTASRESQAVCVNHVGAGDCFAAHMTLALAHGLPLEDAAVIAHSAGRVYVQHHHGRPPFPFEIRKDIDLAGGKFLGTQDLQVLRRSAPGRVVFTNGCFRAPHAGHVAMLRWAKAQGDVLVVGVNSDASARRQRSEGSFILPERQRVAMLAAMEAVDWVAVFDEDDPCEVVKALRPDVLVKGAEYQGQAVPGSDLVEDVRFAPMVDAEKPARLVNLARAR